MNIFNLPKTEEGAIGFLQEKGLLPKIRFCIKGHEMKLVAKSRMWMCYKKECMTRIKIRSGNFFENTRLPFVTCVRFFYAWALDYTSCNYCKQELGMNKNTTVQWMGYMREACTHNLLNKPRKKIGGVGKIVEIDESLFTKRKNNAGRILPPQWIFGGLCRETRECFLIQVPDRSAATLTKAISDNIEEGTTIYSDSWRGYKSNELEEAGFEHFKVNHRFNFIDPTTGAHTQTIERLWGSAKWRNKKQRGTARHHLDSYLAEFMCRQEARNEDPFEWTLEMIVNLWPPQTQ